MKFHLYALNKCWCRIYIETIFYSEIASKFWSRNLEVERLKQYFLVNVLQNFLFYLQLSIFSVCHIVFRDLMLNYVKTV